MDITSDIHSQHISRQFNHELEELKTHLMAMGGLVEKQVQDAVSALLDADSSLAERVVDNDRAVNDMQIKIDDECTRVLARRQPAASDLRLVLAVIRAASDLERIGDEASKIARNAIDLIENNVGNRGFVEVRIIGEHVRRMMRDALTSFARFDTELALQVVQEDEQVDSEYQTAMRSLMTFMMEDARSISPVLGIMWILRALERVGDHANNLAEYVVYLVKGLDIRHTDPDDLDQELGEKS
ncbi:phosphate signaling complex protein PhoU [Halomonas elongata]|uniref:Phosphate-specific transport system accessory protein PhoU n=1 Tax=Halomonas elongata (strain ATCC 33173 / DSM 2581 / NBRC 15536 / NCIMB 2198 / 1H9) TaxID=768066 RepID=E1VCD3_HALED|nr:phosphate signaling complex protein PhoU [Halomonas elongata]MBW5800288.1 phosphate signaling complex protein PhoU [Halomonas elongata]MDL4862025.1 phosphate signaling complex protein PhoU [Halomonas elongata]RAW08575.1 phosphate transport system regulatory protein PhoU [Halomonas elongata]WBF18075.1 phosphate signaling complex protein PhoU [Halomonas elongata]WPU46925.1 phosphate signaling complex protein PhoU [Halomonas elongata DSM 2581]